MLSSLRVGGLTALLSAILALGPAAARAQAPAGGAPSLPPGPAPPAAPATVVPPSAADPNRPGLLYEAGRGRRNAGITLTLIGAGLLATAIALLVAGLDARHCGTGHDCSDAESVAYLQAAVGTGLGGLVGFGVGLPLWASGTRMMQRALDRGYVPTAAAPFVSPTRGGLVAGLRLAAF
ncbi:MAG TPA: hypothetical protein VGQ83_14565 [Polyangia bacterium]|jgi:hypothetical protein